MTEVKDKKPKTRFATLCGKYRKRMGLTQPQVAERLGVAYRSYCNVEYATHTVINRLKAARLSEVLGLSKDETADFLIAWDESPLSPWTENNRERWKLKNAKRSKAKGYDRIRTMMIDLLDHMGLLNAQCACNPGDFDNHPTTCDLCAAMRELGVDEGWKSPEAAMEHIARISPIAPADRDPAAALPG